MKRNRSLLEYTRDNDTQVSKLGPSGPSCLRERLVMASTDMEWLFQSGETVMAHGPLVFKTLGLILQCTHFDIFPTVL